MSHLSLSSPSLTLSLSEDSLVTPTPFRPYDISSMETANSSYFKHTPEPQHRFPLRLCISISFFCAAEVVQSLLKSVIRRPSIDLTSDGRMNQTLWSGGDLLEWILFVVSIALMGVVYFISPGFVSLGSSDVNMKPYMMSLSKRTDVTTNSLTPFLSKSCRECGHLRPLRSKHCYDCGKCVYRFDHHCYILSSCIGIMNYRWFTLLVASTFSWAVTAFSTLLGSILGRTNHQVDFYFGCVVWLSVLAMLSVYLGNLLGYHIRLILVNATTNEDTRMLYGRNNYPFNNGIWINVQNFVRGEVI